MYLEKNKQAIMKVSVVIINFNSTEHTIKCVNSIEEKSTVETEIIIVDNNSIKDERKELENWLENKKIKYVVSKKNTGFAMGNMLGANLATGDYLFLLNNDCLLLNDAIGALVKFMEGNPDAGLVGPKIFDGEKKHSPSFDYVPTIANKWLGSSVCRKFNKDAYPLRKIEYSSPLLVQMTSGSAMFFRKSCFNQLGGLDTNFFLYCEEEDISIRAAKNGYNIYHVPSAEIIHLCGASTKRSLEIEKEFYISLFYMLEKNYSFIPRVLIKSRYIIKELLKGRKRVALLKFLIKGPSLTKSLRHKMECR